MDERMAEKFKLTFLLVRGLRAYEWERIKKVVDRQYAEKANKLALDDLSEESLTHRKVDIMIFQDKEYGREYTVKPLPGGDRYSVFVRSAGKRWQMMGTPIRVLESKAEDDLRAYARKVGLEEVLTLGGLR